MTFTVVTLRICMTTSLPTCGSQPLAMQLTFTVGTKQHRVIADLPTRKIRRPLRAAPDGQACCRQARHGSGGGGRARARVCVWRGRDSVGAGRNAHVLARFGIRRELGDPKRSYKDAGTSPLNSQSFAAAIKIFVVDLAVDDASFSLPKSRVWYQTQVK